MRDEILDAVVECLRDPHQLVYHDGFVNYLTKKEYAAAAFQADRGNLAALGSYIKWREWLIILPIIDSDKFEVSNDTRADFPANTPVV